MFHPNQIIKSKRSNLLAKVKYIDSDIDKIQIEYVNPKDINFTGLFTYPMKDFSKHWDIIDNPDNKVISLAPFFSHQSNSNECQHQWVYYSGFLNSYYFCSRCDKKQD